ncbi:MAG: NADH-ubiquinone oxidoreductase-F iron-sulfur binding region domain-containing protein [Mycobacterium sp.]
MNPPPIPRLFAAQGPTLADHRARFGELPSIGADLIPMLQESGLSGRGGAGFPAGTKMAAVTGRKAVVVGNGAEGEPLSRKDAQLLSRAPHLVLDGLDLAAGAVGAHKVYLYLHPDSVAPATAALEQRRAAGLDPHKVTVVEAPDRFVAGEESAAIRRIEGGPALPRDRTAPAAVSGVKGRPTLFNNVETLANMALIARFGAHWFRSVGDEQDPGSMLVTLSGALDRDGVVEVPTGNPLTGLIEHAGGTDPRAVQALLIGGYHGSWFSAKEFADVRLSRPALKPLGASPGAGIVHALGTGECGLASTASIATYLAEQSARQCGPCLNGLPRMAELLNDLAHGRPDPHAVRDIQRIAGLVDGRGACRHPDGTARMVRSALRTFSAEVNMHQRRSCSAAG